MLKNLVILMRVRHWILNNGSHGLWSIDSKTTERTSNQSFLCSEIMAGNVYGIKIYLKFLLTIFNAFSTNNEFRF